MSKKIIVCNNNNIEIYETNNIDDVIEDNKDKKEISFIIIDGEVIANGNLLIGTNREKIDNKEKQINTGKIAIVLDQMFKGFSEILNRETNFVEVHDIVGKGLQFTIKVSDRLYKEPANDDYDVLKVVERIANENKFVIFFTGDKKLAAQAASLGNKLIEVHYFPPNEFSGKESVIKSMISEIKSKTTQLF
ncbi:MAG: hypothetical protein ACP5I6_02995 [Caldisphaera sp.]|jgi:hypothetical protein|nr:hypothetical protein [Caldisphaera sp.]PMP60495.1 MAG: hypothetical protein C0201_02700 [Caldisphaera sp.]PMP90510.1 MAG: hypothetical protein C0171_05000 [Caldisphaera sp.]